MQWILHEYTKNVYMPLRPSEKNKRRIKIRSQSPIGNPIN